MRHVPIVYVVALATGLSACDSGRRNDTDLADSVADSQVPEVTDDSRVVRIGACPFECCQYNRWTARVPITVYGAERDTLNVTGRLEAGTQFEAETGNVHVSPIGLVVVTDSVSVERPGGGTALLSPGDTVRVLDYIGEGYYHVMADDDEFLASAFWAPPGVDRSTYGIGDIRGDLVRAPGYDWWVRIRDSANRIGWIRMTEGVRVDGDDACAGPPIP